MQSVRVGIIGAGKIAVANHLPGLKLSGRATVVGVCDPDPRAREAASAQTGAKIVSADYRELVARDDIDAVIVATPNFTHPQIVLAAVAAHKHVLCEKPLALKYTDAKKMYDAAERAGVRHMTAFTYRFVPAMRYLKHLVDRGDLGEIRHFRAQRFQDWGTRKLGWRQHKNQAGTGELADMLSHRIDYGHHLIGRIDRVVADMRTFIPVRDGEPTDVDDWVALLADFHTGASGVLESTKLATGRGEGHHGQDIVELNAADATIVYTTQRPYLLQCFRRDKPVQDNALIVPDEFLVWPGSPRDPRRGNPLEVFRYDQDVEFINAILENRPCNPTFAEGAAAQAVMDAAVLSTVEQSWISVSEITGADVA